MLLVYTPRCPCLASTGSDVLVVLRVLVLVIIMLPPVGKRKFSVAFVPPSVRLFVCPSRKCPD